MKNENKMVLLLITKSMLEEFNKDYYHKDKYDTPRVDVYDLPTQEGSLLANMEQADRCANVISIYWNVLEDAKCIKRKSESLSFIISPAAKKIIDTFDTESVRKLTHVELGWKFKDIFINKDWIVIDAKRYHTVKRSTHHLIVEKVDPSMTDEDLIFKAINNLTN